MVDTLVSGTRILLGCASSSLVPGIFILNNNTEKSEQKNN